MAALFTFSIPSRSRRRLAQEPKQRDRWPGPPMTRRLVLFLPLWKASSLLSVLRTDVCIFLSFLGLGVFCFLFSLDQDASSNSIFDHFIQQFCNFSVLQVRFLVWHLRRARQCLHRDSVPCLLCHLLRSHLPSWTRPQFPLRSSWILWCCDLGGPCGGKD